MSTHIFRGCVLAIALGAGVGASAQTTGPRMPPLVIHSFAGRDLFDFYCATCHGHDAKGQGPVAPALRVPPPDLTRLARDNGGAFPRQRVAMFVTHSRPVPAPAHGTSDMPVWGPVFRGLDPSDALVKLRIANVVDYIASMQEQ